MAFPHGEAGAPSVASRRQPEMSNSRASSSHTAQRGKLPFAANQRRGATRSNLSARGSSRAPQLLLVAPLLWLAANGSLPLWAVWLLLARELLISGWRRDASDGAPASPWGKAKTILQFVSLLMLLWPDHWGARQAVALLQQLGWWLFWPSLVLALQSAFGYLRPRR